MWVCGEREILCAGQVHACLIKLHACFKQELVSSIAGLVGDGTCALSDRMHNPSTHRHIHMHMYLYILFI